MKKSNSNADLTKTRTIIIIIPVLFLPPPRERVQLKSITGTILGLNDTLVDPVLRLRWCYLSLPHSFSLPFMVLHIRRIYHLKSWTFYSALNIPFTLARLMDPWRSLLRSCVRSFLTCIVIPHFPGAEEPPSMVRRHRHSGKVALIKKYCRRRRRRRRMSTDGWTGGWLSDWLNEWVSAQVMRYIFAELRWLWDYYHITGSWAVWLRGWWWFMQKVGRWHVRHAFI